MIDENTSDGYHTFKELYEFRLLYNAAMFNELYRTHQEFDIHKSWKHSDGELAFGGGWFVVVAQLPTGQITNHYEEKDWHLFDIEQRDIAAVWDGHTPADVAKRLREYAESYESLHKRRANDDMPQASPAVPLEAELDDLLLRLSTRAYNHGVYCEAKQIDDEEPKLSQLRAEAKSALLKLLAQSRVDELEKCLDEDARQFKEGKFPNIVGGMFGGGYIPDRVAALQAEIGEA